MPLEQPNSEGVSRVGPKLPPEGSGPATAGRVRIRTGQKRRCSRPLTSQKRCAFTHTSLVAAKLDGITQHPSTEKRCASAIAQKAWHPLKAMRARS